MGVSQMKNFRVKLNQKLVNAVDKIASELNLTRADFFHLALRKAVKKYQSKILSEKSG